MNQPRTLDSRTALAAPAALSLLCGLGFAIVYVLTVRTTPGREFGDASLRGALFTHSGISSAVDTVLAVVSVATLLAATLAVALIALIRLRRLPGLVAVGVLVAANASTWLLKTQLLSRPDLGLRELTPATHNSLPSGHTTAVFSAVIALLIVVPRRGRRPVAIVGGVGAVMIALATMSAGWHRAGDSIAAFLLVGAWAGIAATVTVLSTDHAPARAAAALRGRTATPWLIVMTAGSLGVGCCLALGLVLIKPLRTSTVGAVAAFLAGAVLIIAAATTVLLAELAVLDRTDRDPAYGPR